MTEGVAAVAESACHGSMDVVRRGAGPKRGLRRLEVLLVRVEHSRDVADLSFRLAGLVRAQKGREAVGVDADGVANGLELRFALDRSREIELHVERNQLRLVAESHEVPNGEDVVESVHAHALTREAVAQPVAGTIDEDLILDYSSVSPVGTWTGTAYDGVTGLVTAGRITSSSASGSFTKLGVAEAAQSFNLAAPDTALFDGQTVDSSAVLIKFTYGGDANLDGKLNVDDYGRIDFNVGLGSSGWFNGDFNLDGKINVDDYGIIDFNVSIQGPAL